MLTTIQPVRRFLRATKRAFTLVEMLVVMLLLSVMVFGLMAMFNATQKAFRSSVTQTDVLEGGRVVADLMARELSGMVPSYGGRVTNFYAEIPDFPAGWQSFPGTIALPRTNALENIFFLTRENQKWLAHGYCFTNSSDGAATLFSYYAETNINADPGPLWASFIQQTNIIFKATNLNRIMDGVVQLRIRAYDTNGAWITSPFTNSMTIMATNYNFLPIRVLGEVGHYIFTSNAVPAYVEFELGILEKRAYERFKTMPDQPARVDFLARQIGKIHLFRQRVPIRMVDISAYQ